MADEETTSAGPTFLASATLATVLAWPDLPEVLRRSLTRAVPREALERITFGESVRTPVEPMLREWMVGLLALDVGVGFASDSSGDTNDSMIGLFARDLLRTAELSRFFVAGVNAGQGFGASFRAPSPTAAASACAAAYVYVDADGFLESEFVFLSGEAVVSVHLAGLRDQPFDEKHIDRALLPIGKQVEAAQEDTARAVLREALLECRHVIAVWNLTPRDRSASLQVRKGRGMDQQEELKESVAQVDFERAQRALDYGAGVNARDDDGTTPLFWASFSSRDLAHAAERVRWLLAAGARVAEEHPEHGVTSVHTAAERGDLAVLELLLAADGRCALGSFDHAGRTPLICAVTGHHVPAVILLIKAGSDVNAIDEAKIGNSALRWAVEGDDPAMVELLLSHGADPSLPGWMGSRRSWQRGIGRRMRTPSTGGSTPCCWRDRLLGRLRVAFEHRAFLLQEAPPAAPGRGRPRRTSRGTPRTANNRPGATSWPSKEPIPEI